jgi:KipI family sensor histidine kinase inhibitor
VGERGLLVLCDDAEAVRLTYAELRARAVEIGAAEVVPAARTVLLDGLTDPEGTLERLASWEPQGSPEGSPQGSPQDLAGPEVEIEVTYDGPDLDEVAGQWGRQVADVVRIHQECTFVVAFCGFAPGFAYCTGLPDGLVTARRAEPRAAVPVGSVALAGEFTSVYPRVSPGGWQLIGTTSQRLWFPERAEPALLAPGTRVRFVGTAPG